ncbi:ABC transporter permease [Thermopolyspora sp. NPDC052614]|uniref:ABC transporter permease n=1 Tax=Thermopolyspora sp. NPDC052614 TaxID=3155682 RepID=UPI003416587B
MNGLTGTLGLARLILRRDRFLLPLWILLVPLVVMASIGGFQELLPTEAARLTYYEGTAKSPAIIGMLGPVYGADLGALVAQRSGFMFIVVSLISLLTVIRHTRTEEEAGRRELLGATVVGRNAPLFAALLVTFAANVVLGLLTGLGLQGGGGLAAGGSFAFGLALAACGWVFAAVGAVAAQLAQSAGAARGIGLAVLGLAFALRLAGDTAGEDGATGWLSWLSPIGWGQHIRAFADERWWLLAPSLAAVVLLVAAAVPLTARRDLGAGILPPRPGPADAAPYLRGPLGLAWRLHRALVIGWGAGFVVLGLMYGSAADAVEQALKGNAELQEMLARLGGSDRFSDAFIAAIVSVMALAASGYAIQAALRMRAEEAALRSEPVLAGSVSRVGWAAGHLVFAVAGPAFALALGGLTAGVVYGAASGDVGGAVPRVLGAALVQLPAVAVLGALATLLFGLVPRFAAAAWAVFGACVLLGQVGALLRLDERILDLSPFTHVPQVPAEEVTLAPLAWLTGIAAAFILGGLAGLRRRDIPVT